MLLLLKSCVFSAKNNQVSDRRKSCGRPNILRRPVALRTSVVPQGFPPVTDVICAGKKSIFFLFILWSALFFTTGLGAAESLDSALYALGFRLPEKTLPAVDFELEDLDGRMISLSSMHGKVIFLNFWATWCPPCRAEMPSMEKLYNRFASRDFEIIAIDLQEKNKQVSKFVDDNDLTFKILLDKTGSTGAAYGARSIPTTYIIDRDGSVLARTIGGREWDTAEVFDLFEKILSR